jgi:hypothetical protein
MRSPASLGRLVGALLLAQFLCLMAGFILVKPITTAAFLEDAAQAAPQIRAGVLFLLGGSFIALAIPIAAYPLVRAHSERMALWFVAFGVIWFVMQGVDSAHILSMLSLSQTAKESASNAELWRALGTAARSTRRFTHYSELLFMDVWFLLFYATLFRLSLIPRAVAGFGLLMVAMHAAAIPAPLFIGATSLFSLAYAMLLSYLVVGGWLVVKGFADRAGTPIAD